MMFNTCLVECKTRAGDPCVFPFYYNGTKHYDCIKEDSDKKWCATEVTHEGGREFNWDYCPGNLVLTGQFIYNDAQF